jgi:hypothetical protein
MHPQLHALATEFQQAEDRLRRLAERVPEELWGRRPAPERWGVGECVAHLNLTARAFLPLLDAALEEARSRGGGAPGRYRHDLIGWLLWRASGASGRFRSRTAAAFVPSGSDSPAELRAEFERLQAEQCARVRAADGLPIQKVRIASPFDARVRYNTYSALAILARHQHRHLWQAEQVAAALA